MLSDFVLKDTYLSGTISLNPCCNGRCSLTELLRERWSISCRVLILVVMEDALWHYGVGCDGIPIECLNPCCNGRCSLTKLSLCWYLSRQIVLILVVMEDALWLLHTGYVYLPWYYVLILVVMEDALWQDKWEHDDSIWPVLILVVMEDALWRESTKWKATPSYGLNPCCNGRCSLTCTRRCHRLIGGGS